MNLFAFNAYKLQASMSEKVVVDEHGCHTALKFGVKAKKIKTSFLSYIGYLNSIKTIKQGALPILVLLRQKHFLNC